MRGIHLLNRHCNSLLVSIVFGGLSAEPVAAQQHARAVQDRGSNNFVGSEWRTQMIQNFENAVAEFNAQALKWTWSSRTLTPM
jgi:hypothetical protein